MKLKEDFLARSKLRDIGRWHITQFVKQVADMLPEGGRLLDAGAGECAYKSLFSRQRYVGIDAAIGDARWNHHNLDVIGRLDNLPFANDSFDAILCTETLEHVARPEETLAELFRVLKPGGCLFLTTPFAHEEHQIPHDYFRYTSYALHSICTGAGFSEVRVEASGGLFTRMAYELPSVLSAFPEAGWKSGQWKLRGVIWLPVKALLLPIIRMAQLVLLGLDRFDRRRIYPFGWKAIARK